MLGIKPQPNLLIFFQIKITGANGKKSWGMKNSSKKMAPPPPLAPPLLELL